MTNKSLNININDDKSYQMFSNHLTSLAFSSGCNKKSVKIENGDKLCLVPHGMIPPEYRDTYDSKYENYDDFLGDFFKKENNKYVINIDSRYNTYMDLVCLFVLKSKKVKYDGSNKTIYDAHLKYFELVFNGTLVKYKNVWFLSFDS